MAKRVGILHYTGPGKAVGGVEIVIDYHTRYLAQAGYEIDLVFGDGSGMKHPNVVEHEIPLISPTNERVLEVQKEILSKREESERFSRLKQEIKQELTEVLAGLGNCIIHNIPSMPFNFAATAAINELADQSKMKTIYWVHDSAILRDEWKSYLGRFPFNLLHHRNPRTTYVVPTHFRARQLRQLSEPYKIDNAVVIPNGVNIEEYIKIDETTKKLMKRLGLQFDHYIILLPVRVTPRKNIELALQVVDELKHLVGAAREMKLLVTGPPDHVATETGTEYFDYLQDIVEKRGLQDNVIFCYKLINHTREFEGDEIRRWSTADVYNIADLVFVPSREEGFGLPIIEAGASRKPIFCSRIPPFQELARDNIECDMFDLNEEPKSIAFRIYRAFLHDKVESNYHNIVKRFDWERVVAKLITLL